MAQEKFFPTLFQHLATDTARNLVVSAGAGAGKTAVLTRRIIKIIREEHLTLDRLMVVTFTDKAAVEMKDRIYKAIDREIGRTRDAHFKSMRDNFLQNRISTFHSFCTALLREYPIEAEIDPYFRVLDEVDKVFLLRKVIDKRIAELATDRSHPDLSQLSYDWSRSTIATVVYSIIQKREHTGTWLRDYGAMTWEAHHERLQQYQKNYLREICFKLGRSKILMEALALLQETEPDPPDDESKLSLRRLRLIELLPGLQRALMAAQHEAVSLMLLKAQISEVLEQCNLSGSTARAWTVDPERLDQLRIAFLLIRNVLTDLNLDELEINPVLEQEGFQICQALARVSTDCLTAYREEKAKEHYLDFQDMQLKVLALLRSAKCSHILQELREKYLYIMVDEFQDTNALQWEILKLIASDGSGKLFGDRLFIVGDEKQAIYSFRGGDVTLFGKVTRELIQANHEHATHDKAFSLLGAPDAEKDYQQEYTEKLPQDQRVRAGEIIFSENFRSAAGPIRFFNLFFEALLGKEYYEDFEARPQHLICAGNKRPGSVELLLVDRGATGPDEALQVSARLEDVEMHVKEAHLIASKIKQVLAGDDPRYEHVRDQALARKPAIAILLNRRTKLKIYEEALRRENIDFIVVRGRGFYQRQEIVDFGNLLGFLAERSNDIYLTGFLRSAIGHVSDEGLYLLSRYPNGDTLWEKLDRFCTLADASVIALNPEDSEALASSWRLLSRWHALSQRMILVDFLRLVLDEGGYFASLARGNRGDQTISNIEKLLDRAREVTLNPQESFLSFVQWLNERIDYIEEEGEADVDIVLGGAVQLMTVHQSKGLEFPMVLVPDLNANFNFGEHESVHFDDVTAKLTIDAAGIIYRETSYEIGIDAPDALNNYELTPTLVRRIIERRNREKVIAERKRLLYVAATRAMDHLIFVGQLRKGSSRAAIDEQAVPLDQMRNWMSWLSKILKLSTRITDQQGSLKLGPDADPLLIPYMLYDESSSVLKFEEQLRFDFPDEP